MVLKEFKKLNQGSKGYSWHEENTKVLLTRFSHYFFELTFGHCQLLPPGRVEEEHENYLFSLKMVFPWKIFFGPFWVRKWCLPLTLDIIQVSKHTICVSLLPNHRVIRNIPYASYIYEKPFWKNVIAFLKHITWSCVYFYW